MLDIEGLCLDSDALVAPEKGGPCARRGEGRGGRAGGQVSGRWQAWGRLWRGLDVSLRCRSCHLLRRVSLGCSWLPFVSFVAPCVFRLLVAIGTFFFESTRTHLGQTLEF